MHTPTFHIKEGRKKRKKEKENTVVTQLLKKGKNNGCISAVKFYLINNRYCVTFFYPE